MRPPETQHEAAPRRRLLPDLRGVGRRRHRTGRRARRARPPGARDQHRVPGAPAHRRRPLLPPRAGGDLPALPVPALHAGAGDQGGAGDPPGAARPGARPLRHPALGRGLPRPADGRLRGQDRDHAARHRRATRRARPLVLGDHPLRHVALLGPDRRVAGARRHHAARIPPRSRGARDPELRRHEALCPPAGREETRRDRAPRREGAAARLELPPRQARLGGRRGVLPDRREDPGPALHDRRRPGPAARGGGGARAGHREPRALPQGDQRRRGVVRRRRPAAAPLRDGILRPRAAGGDGLRRAGAGLPRRRFARGRRRRQERVSSRRRRRRGPGRARHRTALRPPAAGRRSRVARARSPCSASARRRSSISTSSTSSRCSGARRPE